MGSSSEFDVASEWSSDPSASENDSVAAAKRGPGSDDMPTGEAETLWCERGIKMPGFRLVWTYKSTCTGTHLWNGQAGGLGNTGMDWVLS